MTLPSTMSHSVSSFYYVDENQRQLGPLSLQDVAEMHRTGSLRGDARLFGEGATTVYRVEDLLVSRGMLPATPPPAEAARCARCGESIAPTSRWCTRCNRSTRDFVYGKLASPLRRLAASFLDGILPSGAGMFAGAGFVFGRSSALAGLFYLAYGIWACLLYSRGATPGKYILDMEVLTSDGDPAGFWRMILREWVAKPISGLFLGLGFFWILIDRENQGWHDKWCDTYVVYRREED